MDEEPFQGQLVARCILFFVIEYYMKLLLPSLVSRGSAAVECTVARATASSAPVPATVGIQTTITDPSVASKSHRTGKALSLHDSDTPTRAVRVFNAEISPLPKQVQGVPPVLSLSVASRTEPYVGFMMMGLRLGLVPQQTQKLGLELGLKDITYQWAEIYQNAEKKIYQGHGLEFEYAAVTREEFPYLVSIGSAGMYFGGMLFVMTNFFLNAGEMSDRYTDLVAVHEYGEHVFNDHHQATLLELEVARREGVLEGYLEFLRNHYDLKIRDISLHRMGAELVESAKEKVDGLDVDDDEVEEVFVYKEIPQDDSTQVARELRDAFTWPEELYWEYSDLFDGDAEREREATSDWADYIVVNKEVQNQLYKAQRQSEIAGRGILVAEEIREQPRILESDVITALEAMERSFYESLSQLAAEFNDDVIDDKYILEDRIREALDSVHYRIRSGLKQAISFQYDTRSVEYKELETIIDSYEFFTRTLSEHLEIAEEYA
ncbi:MAG: hypothetical protein H7A33_06570 [Deltaproteobacteria bacterium]|nr:hypothetical protein [Deltaproteobacteria bacterium]